MFDTAEEYEEYISDTVGPNVGNFDLDIEETDVAYQVIFQHKEDHSRIVWSRFMGNKEMAIAKRDRIRASGRTAVVEKKVLVRLSLLMTEEIEN